MKALFILMLAILAINVSYAGYGEDQKGKCVDGKDSTRNQETVVVESSGDSTGKPAKESTTDQ